jgi:membrane-associated protease RseP (regulator of RpoE activity)
MKIAFLYKTQNGIKAMDYISKKYSKILHVLKYFSISLGYILMIGVLYLLGRTVYLYVRHPLLITRLIKAPPLAPVIPYFPRLFGLESFFPPFYFTYFILALSIVAIVHEFSHGIFARLYKLRIKSTGVLFLGPILGAFVEQDEKQMEKVSKVGQMSILSAGVFANIIVAGIFLLLWMGIFSLAFIPSGTVFDGYATSIVGVNTISMVGGINTNNPSNNALINIIEENDLTTDLVLSTDGGSLNFTKITANGKSYFMTTGLLKEQLNLNTSEIILYGDYPAINTGLKGIIVGLDENEVKTYKDLSNILENYNPGDKVKIKTSYNGEILEYNLVLDDLDGRAFIGIGVNTNKARNIEDTLAFFKSPYTKYEIKSEFLEFLYYLVFWIFLINLLVAFFNMLPFAILDGGRFFYLTIWGITKNEKIAKKIYKWIGMLILFSLILMMFIWLLGIIIQ